MKLFTLLAMVALAACNGGKGPPAPDSTKQDTTSFAGPPPFRRALVPQARALALIADTALVTQNFIIGEDTVTISVRISTRRVDTIIQVDTVIRVDTVAPPPAVTSGQVFGPSSLNETTTGIAPFGWSTLSGGEGSAKSTTAWAAANKIKYKLNIPGGSHSAGEDGTGPNLSIINGVLQFDRNKWNTRVDKVFAIPGLKDTLLAHWKRGLLQGIDVMDEPHVAGSGDGNTWGPAGTMTKIRVDSLCQYIKDKIASVPVGVSHQPQAFQPDKNYKVCDFTVNQWSVRSGNRGDWMKLSDSIAKRQGTQTLYSINPINGGVQDKDGTWDCSAQAGVKGQREPNCAMMPDTLKAALLQLGTRSVGGQMMWRYQAAMVTRNAVVFKQVADSLKKVPFKPLKRR